MPKWLGRYDQLSRTQFGEDYAALIATGRTSHVRRLKFDRTLAGPSDTELLDACGEETAYALESLGAGPRRLDDLEIAELLYSCWCPERASQQPLVPAAVVRTIATRIPTSSDAAATGPGAATAKAAAA